MKFHAPFLTVLVFSVLMQCSAQKDISFPLKEGNILVYHLDSTNSYFGIRYGVMKFQNDLRFQPDTFKLASTILPEAFGFNSRPYLTRNSKNMLIAIDYYSYWFELFPCYIPDKDSIKLYSYHWTGAVADSNIGFITRRFDTTVFSKRVSAYTMKIRYYSDTTLVTIADVFGYLKSTSLDGKRMNEALKSAYIDSVKYNWNDRRWETIPLCVGNVWQYKQYSEYMGTKDTLINEERIVRRDTLNSKEIFYSSDRLKFWYEDSVGIMSDKWWDFPIYYPKNSALGNEMNGGFIVDTSSIFMNGKILKTVSVHQAINGWNFRFSKWIEGIGKTYEYFMDDISLRTDTLLYAQICGNIVVAVENKSDKNLTSCSLSQNYPNPFSSSTAITYHLSSRGHVRLEVFDLLGRKIATLVDEEKEAGAYTSKFSAGRFADVRSPLFSEGRFAGIHPGVYFYRLVVGKNVMTRKMIVME